MLGHDLTTTQPSAWDVVDDLIGGTGDALAGQVWVVSSA